MAKPRRREPNVSAPSGDISAPQYAGDTTAANGDRQRIAERAYELYVTRGGGDGRDLDDWLEAERDLASPRNEDHEEPDPAA
jgi:hypothetical protein